MLGAEELELLDVELELELLLTWLELVLAKRLLLLLELVELIPLEAELLELIWLLLVLAKRLLLLELELLVELAIGSCTIVTFTCCVRFLCMYLK